MLGAVFAIVALVLPALLDVVGALPIPLRVWLEIAGFVVLPIIGFALGQAYGFDRPDPNADRYVEHTTDALGALQRVMLASIAPIGIRDFVQEGLLEPAHSILATAARGEVRFSILVPEGDEFRMRHALGHDMESRRAFRLAIHKSFAGLAYNEREPKYSDDTERDHRFKPHPRARAGREYRSIVAVPLRTGDAVFGVFVAVATKPHAFSRADRIYLQELAAIMDVARATGTIRKMADDPDDDQTNG